MAITYDVPNNIITATGYSLLTPCNFTDLYNADKTGTLSLHARTGITGTDGAAVAVDRAERPADFIVLGGAGNDLYITVANWNGTTATIRITGTDRDGTAQTEDIVVNANGAFYTTKWFKTITHTQVTGATVTTFDYDLTQGQWGVVWKQGGYQFKFGCRIILGDGSTPTYFTDVDKHILMPAGVITADWQMFIGVKRYTHFTVGHLEDATEKTTSGGCSFYIEDTGHYMGLIEISTWSGDATVKLYGSTFISGAGNTKECDLWMKSGNGTMYNCFLDGIGIRGANGDWNINRINAFGAGYGLNRMTTGTFNDIVLYKQYIGIYTQTTHSLTLRNSIVKGATYKSIRAYKITTHKYFIDCDLVWNIHWSGGAGTSTAYLYRQYSFNLKVTDKDGSNINGATVKIRDKDDSLVVDTTTAAGVITEQTISRGYYNQANGDTLQEKSPHTIEIKKAGYQTYKTKFTMDKKSNGAIRLIHSAVNPDQEAF